MTDAELKELSRQLADLSRPSVRDFYSEAHAACAIQNGRPLEPRRRICQQHRIKQMRTRPYTPRTNGKAERFIQTALRQWAYGCAYNTSEERRAIFRAGFIDYNWHRPHGSLGGRLIHTLVPASTGTTC